MSYDTLPAAGQDQAVVRANAYHALVKALAPPTDWSASFPEELRLGLSPVSGKVAERAGELVDAAEAAMSRLESASVAHARLFVGPFEVKAAPWASLYLDEDQQLMGEASQYAAEAYAEAGLGPSARGKDAPDHITHELEFMYYLAFQEATTGETGWRSRQQRFWVEHLGQWLPRLATAVRRADLDPFYNALVELLLAFAEAEDVQLGVASPRLARKAFPEE